MLVTTEQAVVTLPLSQLVFDGQVLDGFDVATVKRCPGEHLRLDAARLNHLFSGQRVVIRRSIERELGLRHVQQFARLGAQLQIEDVEATNAPAAAPPPPRTNAVPALLSQADGLSLVPLAGETTPAQPSITCPTCGEVQPRAVFCRSCVTNMPMGIAALAQPEVRSPGDAEVRSSTRGSDRATQDGDASRPDSGSPRLLGLVAWRARPSSRPA